MKNVLLNTFTQVGDEEADRGNDGKTTSNSGLALNERVQAAMPRGHNATGPQCHRSYMQHQSYGSGSQCFLIYI